MLVKLALEPEWEAKFELNSYGFRPGRSCHDAIGAIFSAISKKPKYVLDADIAKCFDRINHKALLDKINTYPSLRRQIKAWLKSGVIDDRIFVETTEGTPQGGCISPLLANIALHGMEQRIRDAIPGKSKPFERKKPNLIRYADNLVILHSELEIILKCQRVLTQWLKDMGLELKPSKESIKNHYRHISETIKAYKNVAQIGLIHKLNPIIRGWSNYYSPVVSKEIFTKLDHLVVQRLITWGRSRHPNKGIHWVIRKYFKYKGNNPWSFATNEKGLSKDIVHLASHKETPIVRHIKVQGDKSPYNGNLVYWSSRMGKHPEMPKRIAQLLKSQKGKCCKCGLMFREGDTLNIDHIIPRSQGGKDKYNNLQLLHKHCHDIKTAHDRGMHDRGMYDKHQPIEERYEGKLSRTVLKTSREGDFSA